MSKRTRRVLFIVLFISAFAGLFIASLQHNVIIIASGIGWMIANLLSAALLARKGRGKRRGQDGN